MDPKALESLYQQLVPSKLKPAEAPNLELESVGRESEKANTALEKLAQNVKGAGEAAEALSGQAQRFKSKAESPRKITLDDFATPTPRAEEPRKITMQDFGFKPVARPVRPIAREVGDDEIAREQWTPAGALKDAKGYLPFGIGQKLGGKFETMGAAYKAASSEAAAAGAGTARAAAAGVGEAAVAAGPAAALAVAEIASVVVTKGLNSVRGMIEHTGRQLSLLAENSHLEYFKSAVDAASSSLSEIPIVGKVLAAGLQLAAAPIRVFADTVNAFVARGKELSGFSGDLAAANATADVRSLMSDIAEAQRLGPDLARLTDAQSRIENDIRELLLPIKEAVVKVLANLLEMVADGVDNLKRLLVIVGEGFLTALEAISRIVRVLPGGGAIADLIDKLRRFLTASPAATDPITGWLAAADTLGLGLVPGVRPPAPAMPPGVLPIP